MNLSRLKAFGPRKNVASTAWPGRFTVYPMKVCRRLARGVLCRQGPVLGADVAGARQHGRQEVVVVDAGPAELAFHHGLLEQRRGVVPLDLAVAVQVRPRAHHVAVGLGRLDVARARPHDDRDVGGGAAHLGVDRRADRVGGRVDRELLADAQAAGLAVLEAPAGTCPSAGRAWRRRRPRGTGRRWRARQRRVAGLDLEGFRRVRQRLRHEVDGLARLVLVVRSAASS